MFESWITAGSDVSWAAVPSYGRDARDGRACMQMGRRLTDQILRRAIAGAQAWDREGLDLAVAGRALAERIHEAACRVADGLSETWDCAIRETEGVVLGCRKGGEEEGTGEEEKGRREHC